MSDVTQDKLVVSAPTEPAFDKKPGYTDQLICSDLKNCDNTLNHLFEKYFEGCANIDIVKIYLKVTFTGAKQHAMAGFQEAGGSAATQTLAGKLNGCDLFSGETFLGSEGKVFDLTPEDYLSRQIRPVSAMLPEMKFCVDISEQAHSTFTFRFNVHGVRNRVVNLSKKIENTLN